MSKISPKNSHNLKSVKLVRWMEKSVWWEWFVEG